MNVQRFVNIYVIENFEVLWKRLQTLLKRIQNNVHLHTL